MAKRKQNETKENLLQIMEGLIASAESDGSAGKPLWFAPQITVLSTAEEIEAACQQIYECFRIKNGFEYSETVNEVTMALVETLCSRYIAALKARKDN